MSAAKRALSKRELEEVKKKNDLMRSAEVFTEFVEAFEKPEAKNSSMTFVRGGMVVPGKGEESHAGDSSDRLYALKAKVPAPDIKPTPRPSGRVSQFSSHPPVEISPSKPVLVKKAKDKKKSNLEMFKDELKQIQEEREERKKLKDQISKIESKLGTTVSLPPSAHSAFLDEDLRVFDGTYDLSGDASSTNLYMGNIAPNISEEQLCEIFGKFGPIASVKIMYPRGEDREEVRSGRSTLCGFVAFMCRIDADRALAQLRGKDVMGFEMRLGWGKAVNIPTFPIFVPPKLSRMLEPPQHSGLPFNAQPTPEDESRLPIEGDPPLPAEILEDILSRSTVRVTQPQDRTLLGIIHRVIEFVVREGPIFEAMIMQREKGNPLYRFLFDNRCNEHVYYRWKLFSILQGDTPTLWKMKEFYMFEGGPLWKPPALNPFTAGMPEELVDLRDDHRYVKESDKKKKAQEDMPTAKTGITDEDRERMEKMLDDLVPSRDSVADAMVFCIDHAENADEVISAVVKSIHFPDDPPMKKVAKIYLISDILHNCSSVHVQNAWYYRNGFEQKFPSIFTQIKKSHKSIEGRLKAEQYKQRVMNCFRAWEDWAVYPPKYLIRLQNIFLGLEPGEEPDADPDVDGKPIPEPVVESKSVLVPVHQPLVDVDIDGAPMEEDFDGAPLEESGPAIDSKAAPVAFAPSRWETIDPEQVKAQAITTSKWDLLDSGESAPAEPTKAQSSKKIDDHVREQLREIENRVLKYQDELETGKRKRTTGESMSILVDKYRKELLRSTTSSSSKPTSSSSSTSKTGEKRSRRSRSRSKSPPRKRAPVSPPPSHRSRSPITAPSRSRASPSRTRVSPSRTRTSPVRLRKVSPPRSTARRPVSPPGVPISPPTRSRKASPPPSKARRPISPPRATVQDSPTSRSRKVSPPRSTARRPVSPPRATRRSRSKERERDRRHK